MYIRCDEHVQSYNRTKGVLLNFIRYKFGAMSTFKVITVEKG